MAKYFSNEQKKEMISELQAIKLQANDLQANELQMIEFKHGIIEFLRKYLSDVYADVFEKENEAKAGDKINEKNKEGYIFDYFQRNIADTYKIECCNVSLNYIKAILFFKHIMKYLEESDDVNVERNMKIKEYKEVYNLFIALASEENCDLSKHPKAGSITGMTGKKQEELDKNEDHISHITYANYIYDTFLIKYIEEYKNYL